MQEIMGKIIAYASMVKSLDPNALVAGPEEWGWNGYFYSGYDQQWSGQHNNFNPADYPDRETNGGWDYMPWLLNQLHQYNTTNGQRLLDYFTLHCYPQEGSVSGDAVDTATELLRNQSTRQFWDSNYVDPSWINSVIMLIPRMSNWVTTYYPGTKIGITEYNWGAEPYMNGATAQADIQGIFGRQGLDLATRWTIPASTTPTYLAMKIYRNYDSQGHTFGDTSVLAGGPDPDNVSVFAAQRSSDEGADHHGGQQIPDRCDAAGHQRDQLHRRRRGAGVAAQRQQCDRPTARFELHRRRVANNRPRPKRHAPGAAAQFNAGTAGGTGERSRSIRVLGKRRDWPKLHPAILDGPLPLDSGWHQHARRRQRAFRIFRRFAR